MTRNAIATMVSLCGLATCTADAPQVDVVSALRARLETCGVGAFEHPRNVALEPQLSAARHAQRIDALATELAMRIGSPLVEIHAGTKQSCTAAIADLRCDEMPHDLARLFAAGTACRAMFEGASEVEDPCLFDTDCARTPLVCTSGDNDLLPESVATGCGVCVEPVQRGEVCWTNEGDSRPSGTCEVGTSCEWQLESDGQEYVGRCADPPPPGTGFQSNAEAVELGDACPQFRTHCKDGDTSTVCDAETATCVRRPGIGEACDGADPLSCDRREGWCLAGTPAEGEDEPPPAAAVCVASNSAGAACLSGAECGLAMHCGNDLTCQRDIDDAVSCAAILGE